MPRKDRSMKRRTEARLWHFLQQVPVAQRRRILETLSENQRLALERWVLGRAQPAMPPPRDPRRRGLSSPPRHPRAGSGRSGVPGICSHVGPAGRIRYDARVSCWPFRLCSRMSSDLPTVLKDLELLNSVKERFRLTVQDCSWQCGQGSRPLRDFRWQCFSECLATELHARGCDGPELGGHRRGLCWQACICSHFLLGRRLLTPFFPVTRRGLQRGHRAWGALSDAVEASGGSGEVPAVRRNRWTSLQRGKSKEELQEAWQKIRQVYTSVWTEAGQSHKRLSAQLATLEQHFRKRSARCRDRCASAGRDRAGRAVGHPAKDVEAPEQKICRLLQRWNKRKRTESD